jgi:SlyX protein
MSEDLRLTHLEERYAHLQRHQREQDKAVLELSEEVTRLRRELKALQTRTQNTSSGEGDPLNVDERPPHY